MTTISGVVRVSFLVQYKDQPSFSKVFFFNKGTVIYTTRYSEYWKQNIKLFKAGDFIAELTQHIPPKHKHLILYYGLYSSRTKGKVVKGGSLEKFGYTPVPQKIPEHTDDPEMETMSNKASRRSSGAAHTKDLRSRPSDLSKMRS